MIGKFFFRKKKRPVNFNWNSKIDKTLSGKGEVITILLLKIPNAKLI